MARRVVVDRCAMSPIYCYLYGLLIAFYQPQTWPRVEELAAIAADIASTDATDEEAELLVDICIHESRCSLKAVGDGGRARGAWQVRGKDASAAEALRRVRWSYAICGDLSAYAGCGRCGSCPNIVKSLGDPSLPRR